MKESELLDLFQQLGVVSTGHFVLSSARNTSAGRLLADTGRVPFQQLLAQRQAVHYWRRNWLVNSTRVVCLLSQSLVEDENYGEDLCCILPNVYLSSMMY